MVNGVAYGSDGLGCSGEYLLPTGGLGRPSLKLACS